MLDSAHSKHICCWFNQTQIVKRKMHTKLTIPIWIYHIDYIYYFIFVFVESNGSFVTNAFSLCTFTFECNILYMCNVYTNISVTTKKNKTSCTISSGNSTLRLIIIFSHNNKKATISSEQKATHSEHMRFYCSVHAYFMYLICVERYATTSNSLRFC